jgi:hypothetical protein
VPAEVEPAVAEEEPLLLDVDVADVVDVVVPALVPLAPEEVPLGSDFLGHPLSNSNAAAKAA